ncbi:hypothetical protein [Marinospirillum sp.]|uniref:hypothetical protein n=1 Tax=Marinospirillum sp. TaxID=2183934 RepID=UPI00287049D2|nr:hypothetical protein [Marinospirillum sp.]MDR9468249.1 hypothetical protein [Marinospirillum sp.]
MSYESLTGGSGLSKREMIAAMIMQGLASTAEKNFIHDASADVMADSAVRSADILLKKLEELPEAR